jgi:hypothetical protein
MAFFNKLDRPVFLKEESDVTDYISRLKALQNVAKGALRETIDREIKFASIGEFGENNIAFELKNSGMPMYILRDIHIESGDLTAQIDFIVVTRKMNFIIECKNLIGNIEIDDKGNFIRSYVFNGKRIREGIYSPITQNQRHLQVLKQILKDAKTNTLAKTLFCKFYNNFFKSIVVLANPKTLLNAKNAKKEIREKVIRADQLIQYIKDVYSSSKDIENNDKDLKARAERLLKLHTPNKSDYAKKYQEIISNMNTDNRAVCEGKPEIAQVMKGQTTVKKTMDKASLVQKLKSFRLEKCREENIKPYFIFNDKQMRDLIKKMPDSKASLLKVWGFGDVKVDKYGEEILEILDDFR